MADASQLSRARIWGALAAVLLAPLVLRATLVAERLSAPALADLRGLASDTAVSFLALAVCAALARLSRVAAVVAVALWVLVQVGAYEVVRALGSPATLAEVGFLSSPTFVWGSALAPSRPLLFAALLVVTIALAWRGLPLPSAGLFSGARGSALLAGCGVLGLGLLALWPWNHDVAAWRPAHFLERDGRLLVRGAFVEDASNRRFVDSSTAMLDLDPGLAADLVGEPRIPLPGKARNVLLVVVESVSGLFVDRLSAFHQHRPLRLMPSLDAITGKGIGYTSFFAHQRKTNRGLYALLCGALPNLQPGLPKMSSYTEGGRACLPELLAREGWRTRYLQAAPLAFMMKDRFMPAIGFERSDGGGDFFPKAYAKSAWGVDDRAFFEQAIAVVEELREQDEPWFLTLLTVGTHHPFVVPSAYRPKGTISEQERTLRYADLALGELDRRLRERAVYEDTLVIYTSDESMGATRSARRVDRLLSNNWGLLIVRAPGVEATTVDEPFAQMDVALSVLDYLGLTDRGRHLFGRSVFRRYAVGRNIYFANTNERFHGLLDADGRMPVCMLDFESCRVLQPIGGRVFSPRRGSGTWDPERDDRLREMAARSLEPGPGSGVERRFELVTDPLFAAPVGEAAVVHGGQYVALLKGERLEVELVARIDASSTEGVELLHRLEGREPGVVYEESATLRPGETLRWRYTWVADERTHDLAARTYARSTGQRPVELRFDVARLVVRGSGEPAEPGLHVERFEVDPASTRTAQ